MADPTTRYALDVTAGKIIAGRLVRLACERHLRDLKDGPARGLKFDADRAARALKFFSFLRLGEGAKAGEPFDLCPFQQFIIGSLFGWLGPDGFRRFRTAYLEMAKGNGKSPLAGGVGLMGLVADGEVGAEVYSAATAREQAGILFRDAKLMVEASPALADRLEIAQANIAYPATNSFFRPVSSEHRGLDGKRPHIVLVDELHEHPTPLVVDKMRAGTKSRRQALIFEITNSGYDRDSVCWHHHQYSEQILEQQIEDDSWFAYVCQLDVCDACRKEGKTSPNCPACDQWTDESVWEKANPGLDTILPRKYLREQVNEALGMPSKQNIVLRLNFCVWTESISRWVSADVWNACGKEPVDPAPGLECYGGLDLASTLDIAAYVECWKIGERYHLRPHFWAPEEAAKERERRNKTRIDQWAKAGLITLTPGNAINYAFIRAKILQLHATHPVKKIAFDPWNARQLSQQIAEEDGLELVEFRQGYLTMNEPMKAMEGLLLDGKIAHGGNPVLRWMASNVAVERDAAGNVKANKDKSTEKIDGIVASIMALAMAMLHAEPESVYKDSGILVI